MSETRQPPPRIRVLHLEDNIADHALIREMLGIEGLACDYLLAKVRKEFEAAVQHGDNDLILSDYSLPSYDGLRTLALAAQRQQDVPFIFFPGPTTCLSGPSDGSGHAG